MICGKIIQEVKKRPDCFNKLNLDEYNYRFVECWYGDLVFGSIAFLIIGKECLFHMDVNNWTPSIARTLKWGVFDELFPYLKEHGVRKVAAIKDDIEDKKWHKFIAMFGFGEPINIMYSQRRI